MKKSRQIKNLLKCLALSLTACVFITAGGCFDSPGTGGGTSTGGGGSIVAKLPDYDALKDELRVDITGWVAPKVIDEQAVDYMVEAGINVMFFANAGMYNFNAQAPTAEDLKVADMLYKNGIDVYLHASRDSGDYLKNIELYKDVPGVTGFFTDEPNMEQIRNLSAFVDDYNRLSGNRPYYVNLFPSFAKSVVKEFDDYESYLRFFCQQILSKTASEEKTLSADRYPLTFNGKGEKSLDPGWLSDVAMVAKVGREEGYRTNFFIQTMSFTSNGKPSAGQVMSRDRQPTYEDIRLQEYALMAFGYDSISLFCYATPAMGAGEFIESNIALIDRDGTRSQVYYDTVKANKEILAFDHVLKQFKFQGAFTSNADEANNDKPRKSNIEIGERISVKEAGGLDEVLSSADTLYSYFMDKEENEGFMVVNYNETSREITDEVTLTFDAGYNYKKARVYIAGEPVEKDITDNKLKLTLGAGEGVFVIPYM